MVDGQFITPDWGQSVTETYEFLTDIFVSRSGKEQRAIMRDIPRRTVAYQTLLWGEEAKAFTRMVASKKADSVELLDHAQFRGALASATSSGSNTLTFVKSAPWLTVGRRIAIIRKDGNISTTITAVSGLVVTVAAALTVTVPAGTEVLPRIEALLSSDQQFTMQTDRHIESDISALVKPGTQTFAELLKPQSDPPTLDGRPAIIVQPDWSKLPSYTIATTIDRVDYGRLLNDYAPETVFRNTSQFTFLDRRGGDIYQILNIFLNSRGRAGEFWWPSWSNDLTMQTGLIEGSSRFKVKADLVENVTDRALMFYFADGTSMLRKISHSSTFGAGEGMKWLYVTESFPTTYYRADIKLASWLRLSRFASDSLTIEWVTDTVGRVQATIRSLESLPGDP